MSNFATKPLIGNTSEHSETSHDTSQGIDAVSSLPDAGLGNHIIHNQPGAASLDAHDDYGVFPVSISEFSCSGSCAPSFRNEVVFNGMELRANSRIQVDGTVLLQPSIPVSANIVMSDLPEMTRIGRIGSRLALFSEDGCFAGWL